MSKPNIAKEGDPGAVDLSTNKDVKRTSLNEDIGTFERSDDLRALMQAPWGRRLAWGWLSESRVHQSPVGKDNEETHFNLGRQEWGRWMWLELQTPALIGLFRLMQDEAQNAAQISQNVSTASPTI